VKSFALTLIAGYSYSLGLKGRFPHPLKRRVAGPGLEGLRSDLGSPGRHIPDGRSPGRKSAQTERRPVVERSNVKHLRIFQSGARRCGR